jgi:pimeloyl-ACP methyl ester carboxylesterase
MCLLILANLHGSTSSIDARAMLRTCSQLMRINVTRQGPPPGARFEVITPEHPGFGESDTPDWLDTVHDLAYFDLDPLAQLDLDRVHLVGLSLGGWIAAELAVRDTSRLASLTLVGAAGLHVNGVKQIDPFLRTDEQRICDFFHDQARAGEMIAQRLSPERADIAMKNRATTAKLGPYALRRASNTRSRSRSGSRSPFPDASATFVAIISARGSSLLVTWRERQIASKTASRDSIRSRSKNRMSSSGLPMADTKTLPTNCLESIHHPKRASVALDHGGNPAEMRTLSAHYRL